MRIALIGKQGLASYVHDAVIDATRSRADVEILLSGEDSDDGRYEHAVDILANGRFDGLLYVHEETLAHRLAPHDFAPAFVVPAPAAGDKVALWRSLIDCHFLSFDRRTHETLQRNGCRTSHFQPFPEPGNAGEAGISRETEGMISINERTAPSIVALIDQQCRAIGITALWVISTAPADSATTRAFEVLPYAIVVGAEDRSASDSVRFRLVSPEEAATSLDYVGAMARGQVVVAVATSGAADYVAHLTSGILTGEAGEPLSPCALDADRPRELGRAAQQKVACGHLDWMSDRQRLASIILRDGQRWSTSDASSSFATLIRQRAHERIARVH